MWNNGNEWLGFPYAVVLLEAVVGDRLVFKDYIMIATVYYRRYMMLATFSTRWHLYHLKAAITYAEVLPTGQITVISQFKWMSWCHRNLRQGFSRAVIWIPIWYMQNTSKPYAHKEVAPTWSFFVCISLYWGIAKRLSFDAAKAIKYLQFSVWDLYGLFVFMFV